VACLAIVVIGLAGCGDWTMMTASLSNHSPQQITDISVDLAGVSRSIGNSSRENPRLEGSLTDGVAKFA
jgi:hypothetical protein